MAETAKIRTTGPFAIFSPVGAPKIDIVFRPAQAPVTAGSFAGSLRFIDSSGRISEYPLVFAEDVPSKPLLLAITGSWITWVCAGMLGVSVSAFKGRRQKIRRKRNLRAHAR
jgi:hypothetical protein